MSFAFSRANHIVDCNGQVTNSAITTSTIDMDGGIITSHGTPTNPTDVVNKDYVDASTAVAVPAVTITLTSTAYTTALPLQSGSLMLIIKNLVTDGPAATFFLSKSEAFRQPSISRFTSSDGYLSNEKLYVRWNPSSDIELKKTNSNYDGEYRLKYIAL